MNTLMQNKLLLKVISYQKLKKSILFQKMDSKLCYTFSRSCDVGYYIVSPGFSRGILFMIIIPNVFTAKSVISAIGRKG